MTNNNALPCISRKNDHTKQTKVVVFVIADVVLAFTVFAVMSLHLSSLLCLFLEWVLVLLVVVVVAVVIVSIAFIVFCHGSCLFILVREPEPAQSSLLA